MKSLQQTISFQYLGKDYVLSAHEPSRDTHNRPILWGAVVAIDGQEQKPARRMAFLLEATNLPPQIKDELCKCPTVEQAALEESEQIHAAIRAKTLKTPQHQEPIGKTERHPKTSATDREKHEENRRKFEALFDPE